MMWQESVCVRQHASHTAVRLENIEAFRAAPLAPNLPWRAPKDRLFVLIFEE